MAGDVRQIVIYAGDSQRTITVPFMGTMALMEAPVSDAELAAACNRIPATHRGNRVRRAGLSLARVVGGIVLMVAGIALAIYFLIGFADTIERFGTLAWLMMMVVGVGLCIIGLKVVWPGGGKATPDPDLYRSVLERYFKKTSTSVFAFGASLCADPKHVRGALANLTPWAFSASIDDVNRAIVEIVRSEAAVYGGNPYSQFFGTIIDSPADSAPQSNGVRQLVGTAHIARLNSGGQCSVMDLQIGLFAYQFGEKLALVRETPRFGPPYMVAPAQ